ncbi:MAG: SDR family oxidoreductase [Bacteroidota bacterium]
MNKVVLITGASSGIGKVTAEFLTQKGYKVYGTSRNPKENISNFKLIALDLNEAESIQNAIQLILKKEGKIDILVNNAGTGITGPVEETPTDEIRKTFETNFFGVIEVIKAVLPHMRKQKSGLIINVTSIAGYMGLPYRGIYSAAKSALERVTETIRMEVKKFGIEVTNIAPGDFATNIAAGRYHTPVFKNSAYKDSYQKNLDLMDEHVNSGGDPIEIAKKIYKIIQAPNPKIHYKVGSFIQKFSIILKQILPNKIYEYLIMKHYGL